LSRKEELLPDLRDGAFYRRFETRLLDARPRHADKAVIYERDEEE
jgi:hypothetical protein